MAQIKLVFNETDKVWFLANEQKIIKSCWRDEGRYCNDSCTAFEILNEFKEYTELANVELNCMNNIVKYNNIPIYKSEK